MSNIIIGIHGLSNKPERQVLENEWRLALQEGLRVNRDAANAAFEFRLVYWADLLYKHPLHRDDGLAFDELFDHEKYEPAEPGALQEYEDGFRDAFRKYVTDLAGKALDEVRRRLDTDILTDRIARKVARDLYIYYMAEEKIRDRAKTFRPAREVLRDELKDALRAESGKRIMLIAHSMGSIIAYDSLRDLGHPEPELQVPHFMTLGSPLGLFPVKGRIIDERRYDARVRTPSIVTERWVNHADTRDKVAVDSHLSDDYAANDRGVRVEDDLVCNDYPGNPHKIYGYLRTPEVSRNVADFLGL